MAVAYSPDGKTLASASDDGTVSLWDAATGKPRGEPLAGHKGAVYVPWRSAPTARRSPPHPTTAR